MSILPVSVPRVALYEVARLFLSSDYGKDQVVELIIHIDDEVNLRELSAYLALIDRVYGRLTSQGLRSYAQSKYEQLQIREIRKGSIEVIIEQAITAAGDKTPLIIAWLFLKYLPSIIKASAESAKQLAEAHKAYQDGETAKESRKLIATKGELEIAKSKAETGKLTEEVRVSRENRRQLRQKMKEDEILNALGDKRLGQLATLLDDLYAKEARQLPAAERLAEQKVMSVELNVKDNNESPPSQSQRDGGLT